MGQLEWGFAGKEKQEYLTFVNLEKLAIMKYMQKAIFQHFEKFGGNS